MPRVLLVLALTVGPLASHALGQLPPPQQPPPNPIRVALPHPLDAKELARARRAAQLASPEKLALERVAAANLAANEYWKVFLTGRQRSLDSLLDTLRLVRDARISAASTAVDRLEASLDHWHWAQQFETVQQARFEAFRVPIQDFMEARVERLKAELELAQLRPVLKKVRPSFIAAGSAFVGDDTIQMFGSDPGIESSMSDARNTARIKRRVLNEDPDAIREVMRDAAAIIYDARMRLHDAGAKEATLDVVLATLQSFLEVRFTAEPTQETRATLLEVSWTAAYVAHEIDRARFKAGRIPIQDYWLSRWRRVIADMQLSHHRDLMQKSSRNYPVDFPALEEEISMKDYARAKWAAQQVDPNKHLDEIRELTRKEKEEMSPEYLATSRGLEIRYDSLQRLLSAELLAAGPDRSPPGEIGIRERLWELAWIQEQFDQTLFKDGRIPAQDVALARFWRLDAEIRLAEARARGR